MRIVITGVAGFIGSVLARHLLEAKENYVVGLDDFIYNNQASLKDLRSSPNFKLVRGDILDQKVRESTLSKDIDAIVHLAAIVGQPACSLNVEKAVRTNLDGTIAVAETALRREIEHFVFASTCSVYGRMNPSPATEEVEPNPLCIYSRSKYEAEKHLQSLKKSGFPVTILRFATNYGFSYRMRFDLVINYFVLRAWEDKEITVLGGNQWRPFLYVQDTARAISEVLQKPSETVGQVFNVGDNSQNFTIAEIARIVEKEIPGTRVVSKPEIEDTRSYSVDFSKVRKVLGFEASIDMKTGIKRVLDPLQKKVIRNPHDPLYYNNAL